MTFTRFLWTRLSQARIRAWDNHEKTRNAFVMGLSGVHGTITLAMAFSLPLTLNGSNFPYRNDIIFVAAVVILTSLLVPTILLPMTLPKQTVKVTEDELATAKADMVSHAIDLMQARHGNNASTSKVIAILSGQRVLDGRPKRSQLAGLFDATFEVEQATVDQMVTNKEITPHEAEKYMRVASQTRIQNQQTFFERLKLLFRFTMAKWSLSKKARARRKMFRQYRPRRGQDRSELLARNRQMWHRMRQIEQKPYEAVLAYLADTITADNQQAIGIVRRAYDERHRRLSGERDGQNIQNELLIEAFQLEYNFIQTQLASKTFSSELGNQLYEQISTDQLVYLQSINTD